MMEIHHPLAPNLSSINDHLKVSKSDASCQTETTTCGTCCSDSLLELSLSSLISMRDRLKILSKEISANIDLRSRLNETPPKSSDVNEDQNQEIIINNSHPDKYLIVSCNKEDKFIFEMFSYLGDNIFNSSSDLDNAKSNANKCELKVKTLMTSSQELTTDKGICKVAWNGICKKGKKVNICMCAKVLKLGFFFSEIQNNSKTEVLWLWTRPKNLPKEVACMIICIFITLLVVDLRRSRWHI